MITAFQRNAFQNNAFQIGVTVAGSGGERYGPLLAADRWLRQQRRKAEAERKRREEEENATPIVVEEVVAQAEAIITDLSALVAVTAAAPTPMTKERDPDAELDAFMAFMVKIAQNEDEFA